MTKPNSVKKNGVKGWALQFKHRLGWTTFDVQLDEDGILTSSRYWKQRSPNFIYQIIPVLIIHQTRPKASVVKKIKR